MHHTTRWTFVLSQLRRVRRAMRRGLLGLLVVGLLWVGANLVEWMNGPRLIPWSAYPNCGTTHAAALPAMMRVGLYEEFPTPERLARLAAVDFPVTLAIAAPSRATFLELRTMIQTQYPQVQEVYFWPLLDAHEGYYPGTWSDAGAVQRVAAEAEGLPVLWDLEMPRDKAVLSPRHWRQNQAFLHQWFQAQREPVHLWRSNASMGFDSVFLRLIGMHFDPAAYATLSLHLDLYSTHEGRPAEQLARMLRCGVERYGERFIPSLGILNDGQGPNHVFLPPATLRRDLALVREAGVAEVWLFSVAGLDETYLDVLRETLPLMPYPPTASVWAAP